MNAPAPKKWGVWDAAVCLPLVVGGAWLFAGAAGLEYRWDYFAPLRYIAYQSEDGWRAGLLLEGMAATLRLLLFGGALSLLLGAAVAAALLSPLAAARRLARLYVEGLRHLPPIVFIFIFFYFISSQILSADLWRAAANAAADSAVVRFLFGPPELLENFFGGLLCLALFEAAFFAEIFRAGILSIEEGQRDAAKSLGLSRWQAWRLVIIPQVATRIAAPLAGQMILVIKDSALLSVISVQELTFAAQETAVSTRQVLETWMLAAGLYFILCYPITRLAERLEK